MMGRSCPSLFALGTSNLAVSSNPQVLSYRLPSGFPFGTCSTGLSESKTTIRALFYPMTVEAGRSQTERGYSGRECLRNKRQVSSKYRSENYSNRVVHTKSRMALKLNPNASWISWLSLRHADLSVQGSPSRPPHSRRNGVQTL